MPVAARPMHFRSTGPFAAIAVLICALAACRHSGDERPVPTPAAQMQAAPTPAVAPNGEVEALVERARALREEGAEEEARAVLDEALALSPGHPAASLERAEVLVRSGDDPERAAADAKAAAEAMPSQPRALRVLGQALEETGNEAGAIDAYRRALALAPDDFTQRRVAMLLTRAGRTDEAVLAWEAVRDAAPDDVGAWLELASLYEEADRPASARHAYESAVALAPENSVLQRRFADFLEREGLLAEARAHRAEADRLDPPDAPERRSLRPLLPSKR